MATKKTWVDHGKRPAHFTLWSFTMANQGVKKPFGPVFHPTKFLIITSNVEGTEF